MRSDQREFLSRVLERMEDLPEGLAERLLKLLDEGPEDRSEAIRRVIEEHTRD
jgi:hypothetical protein